MSTSLLHCLVAKMASVTLKDPSSLSNIQDFKCKHLSWNIEVDFPSKVLRCSAAFIVECLKENADKLILDTKGLIIHEVCLKDSGKELPYIVEEEVKPFGKPLEVQIPSQLSERVGSTFEISIKYETTPESSALDWLEPEQTSGKKHPFLFTQCQAIHARSIIPCQDSPSAKLTYDAEVTVPSDLVALMSAIKEGEEKVGDDRMKFKFQQKIPIPSYLLALVAGALEGRDVGPRSKVWAEKDVVEKAAFEFAELESMVSAAEKYCGPYVWGRYDLLVLPPSFPYGGMENPCLTFVTPTLLAGDRSLTGVAAHEIAHSWTGNLVTNETWEHFWLNEGWTRFVESKIIAAVKGEKLRQFQAIGGWNALQDSIDSFGKENSLTALVPDLRGIDPDDAFSSVPYEKGFALLYYLEQLVGGSDVFDVFMRSYIDNFKFKTITTEVFKQFLYAYFKDKVSDNIFDVVDWDSWFHSPGMPPVDVSKMYDSSVTQACENLAARWLQGGEGEIFSSDDLQDFTSHEIIEFLSKLLLEDTIPCSTLKAMGKVYKLSSMKNNEILFRWLRLCVRSEIEEIYPLAVQFLTQQGRMKYIRPLYSEMYKKEKSRNLAIQTFKENEQVYHKIAAAMVAKDLNL